MDLKSIYKGGGSFVALRPQFSSNSESIFVACKNRILQYSTKSGRLFSEFKGIHDRIIGFSVHFYMSHECITACSISGEVVTWKTVTHFRILKKKVQLEHIKSFHVITSEDEGIRVLISHLKNGAVYFNLCDLINNEIQQRKLKLSRNNFLIDVCKNDYFVVAQRNYFYVIEFKNFTKHTYHAINDRYFTCLSCHPENRLILTGDNTGRVVVWQDIFSSKPSQAVFHWHTLPAKCVGFSEFGSYFYSGGEECVLVRWQIENNYEKKFLPRLPASIEHITVSSGNLYVAISTSDNAIRIVDSRFENVSLIQHLVVGDQIESGIVLDPRTKALVMNGNIGQIQFYSVNDNSLLYNVDVVDQNKITNERNRKIENTRVTKIALSKSGLWMATVERRKDLDFSPEIRLKFWNFDVEIQNFKLNTCVELPHKSDITAVLFQPINNESELKCVTVGDDEKFKVWQLVDASTIYSQGTAWKSLYNGCYKNLPCRSSAFSVDGSLVAVSFKHIVTTWLPDSCVLKCSLAYTNNREEIKQIQFGINNQCHLVVSASDSCLNVWNLLTLTLMWTVPIKVSLLIADSITTNMAVITKNKKVFVFEPISPNVIFSDDTLLKEHDGIVAASFVPSKYVNDTRMKWYQRSPIYFIDSQKEIFCLNTDEGDDDDDSDNIAQVEENYMSVFNKMMPNIKVDKTQPLEPVQHIFMKDTSQNTFKQFLDAPIHTMIPIRLMCASLLKSMILQKPS